MTVKLRSGQRPGGREGVDLARRLVDEAGVAAIGFHPRSAAVQHAGRPDYELAAELVRTLDAPVILSGGMRSAEAARAAQEQTGAAAVMLARGALGNPWLFAQLLGLRTDEPTRDEVLDELDWVIDRAVEHLGEERAARYLRKFYPWYLTRLEAPPSRGRRARTRAASIGAGAGPPARCSRRSPRRPEGPSGASLYCCVRSAAERRESRWRAGFSALGAHHANRG